VAAALTANNLAPEEIASDRVQRVTVIQDAKQYRPEGMECDVWLVVEARGNYYREGIAGTSARVILIESGERKETAQARTFIAEFAEPEASHRTARRKPAAAVGWCNRRVGRALHTV